MTRIIESVGYKKTINAVVPLKLPAGWVIEEHQETIGMNKSVVELVKRKEKLYVNGRPVVLFQPESREPIKIIEVRLRLQEAGKKFPNACVLDHLCKHPGFFPSEWESLFVYFLSTILRAPGGNLYVAGSSHNGINWETDPDYALINGYLTRVMAVAVLG
jgi:hypothetical protein